MVGPNSTSMVSLASMTGSAEETMATTRPGAGRPRDSSIDRAVLQVVRDLLVERGYQALTVQEVTRRCGVHVRTVTRRWSSKPVLVAAAILERDDPTLAAQDASITSTGRLADDVRRLIESGIAYLGQPATQAAYPALMSEMRTCRSARTIRGPHPGMAELDPIRSRACGRERRRTTANPRTRPTPAEHHRRNGIQSSVGGSVGHRRRPHR